MELREIRCGVMGCTAKFKEEFYNQGFPEWGHVGGLYQQIETPNGRIILDKCYLCPEHKARVVKILNGEK